MDRELFFLGQVFVDFFVSLFSMKTPKVNKSKVVGVLEADLEEKTETADWVAEAQVEQGQC